MYETIPVNCGVGGRQVRALETATGLVCQERPMARAYRTVDPLWLAERLKAGGFEVQVTRPRARLGAKSGNIWRHEVLATVPEAGEYHRGVRFLCGHDGRTAFEGAPMSMRLVCANRFLLSPMKIWHTDSEMDRILEDPVPFARMLSQDGRLAAERLELLRGVGDCRPWYDAFIGTPKLLNKISLAWRADRGRDVWGVMQALTRTRSPSLGRLATLAITDGWEQTRQGLVPDVWAPVLEKMRGHKRAAEAVAPSN